MFKMIRVVLLLVESVWAIFVGYLLVLTGAAVRAPRRTRPVDAAPRTRFAILVPAHNEENLIASTLENLNALDYPRALYAVHVVADNCNDHTAQIARAAGAIVHERFDDVERGKGYALQWLLRRLWDAHDTSDALVILDADSIVSENFLRVMATRLTRGERVIQAYYAVREPGRAWSISLRYAALAVLHHLRPQARMVLGGSAGLKGNGMVFAADVLRQHEWSASVTEDIEFHMALIFAGERVMFAPDAIVWAEMPGTLAGARTQNIRWERGRVEMLKRYVPPLLRDAATQKSFRHFDAAMEHLIPPFSILAGVSALCLIAEMIVWRARKSRQPGFGFWLAGANALGQIFYLLAGLKLARAPRQAYRALLYAPAFVIWKIWLYARVVLGLDKQGWVRTDRNT
jgi:cellulose synthase/poly-beta-1,6-N-acetylglucosamine synthase-like glycosyltransferase